MGGSTDTVEVKGWIVVDGPLSVVATQKGLMGIRGNIAGPYGAGTGGRIILWLDRAQAARRVGDVSDLHRVVPVIISIQRSELELKDGSVC